MQLKVSENLLFPIEHEKEFNSEVSKEPCFGYFKRVPVLVKAPHLCRHSQVEALCTLHIKPDRTEGRPPLGQAWLPTYLFLLSQFLKSQN